MTLAPEIATGVARLGDILDIDNLRQRVAAGLIDVRRHRGGNMLLLDYSRDAQFRQVWDHETMTCRGLMVAADENGDFDTSSAVLARSFAKFFGLAQHEALAAAGQLPPLPTDDSFEVFAKEDGSLGICYLAPDGRPAVATRGSFHSPQANWATDYLRSRPDLETAAARLLTRGTPCFEIISPVSRIVKVYDFSDLILLGVVDRSTGADLPLEDEWPGRVVTRYDGLGDFRTLTELDWPNEEGFVVRFASGARAKLKFAEYIRRHKIVTGVSTLTLWEHLAVGQLRDEGTLEAHTVAKLQIDHRQVAQMYAVDGDPLTRLLDDVPDEFDDWVRANVAELRAAYAAQDRAYRDLFAELPRGGGRKELAAQIHATTKPRSTERGALFELLEGKSIAHIVWSNIRPLNHKSAWSNDLSD